MLGLTNEEPHFLLPEPPPARPCHLVLFYSDRLGQAQAEHLRGKLRARLPASIPLQLSWWVFPVLRDPRLAPLAIEEAVAADVIVFSPGLSRELPPEVLAFNERWVHQHHEHAGVLAFLPQGMIEEPESIEQSRALENYFQEIARRAHMEFVALDHNRYPLGETPQAVAERNRLLNPNLHLIYDRVLSTTVGSRAQHETLIPEAV